MTFWAHIDRHSNTCSRSHAKAVQENVWTQLHTKSNVRICSSKRWLLCLLMWTSKCILCFIEEWLNGSLVPRPTAFIFVDPVPLVRHKILLQKHVNTPLPSYPRFHWYCLHEGFGLELQCLPRGRHSQCLAFGVGDEGVWSCPWVNEAWIVSNLLMRYRVVSYMYARD